MGRIDVHKAAVGVVGVFEVVAGGVDAGVGGADEGAGVGAVVYFGDDEVDMGRGEHFIEIVVMDGAVLDGGVHGAFGADHALFEAQEGGEIGGSGGSDGDRHGVKVQRIAVAIGIGGFGIRRGWGRRRKPRSTMGVRSTRVESFLDLGTPRVLRAVAGVEISAMVYGFGMRCGRRRIP